MEYEHICPICLENLSKDCVHLKCHHFVCKPCMRDLVKFQTEKNEDIKCPKCRNIEVPAVRIEHHIDMIMGTGDIIVVSYNPYGSLQSSRSQRIIISLYFITVFCLLYIMWSSRDE
jgi:Zinc finger, C3HC4 type (RING finger)